MTDEVRHRKGLRAVKPEVWVKAIESIKSTDLRIRVACIVWWDFFASRPDWHQLDQYLTMWKSNQILDLDVVRNALVQVGYSARSAKIRATPKKLNINLTNTTKRNPVPCKRTP